MLRKRTIKKKKKGFKKKKKNEKKAHFLMFLVHNSKERRAHCVLKVSVMDRILEIF